jgi:hypothetical protein
MKFFYVLILCLLISCQPLTLQQDSQVLFKEDFSRNLRWETFSSEGGSVDIQDGMLRFLTIEPETFFISVPRRMNFGNVRIQVDVQRIAGVQNNLFGILCRYQDKQNYIQLLISSDGYFDISKMQDSERIPLTGEQLSPIENFDSSLDMHQIQADCLTDQLILSVDGVEVIEVPVNDLEFLSGNIGLIAGALQPPGVEIHFDNLVVMMP